jgi:signal transduction histidine kinase
MTPMLSRPVLFAATFTVLLAVGLILVAVINPSSHMKQATTSTGPGNAEKAQEHLRQVAAVLAGPVSRSNRGQMKLVLQAGTTHGLSGLRVEGPNGKVLVQTTAGGEGDTLREPIGDTGAYLVARWQPPVTATTETPASRRSYSTGHLSALTGVALLAGLLAWLAASRFGTGSAKRSRPAGPILDTADAWQERFASLTESYNDLVIDLTMHTHQRQLERRRFFADIEKQKAELIAARDAALAEAMARSRFFAGMTHELRTPMNAIMGFSEAIEKQIFGPDQMERYSDYAHDIRISAQHLLDTINHLLDLAKAESGKLELDDETLDVAGIIGDCMGMLRRMAENEQVTLVSRPGHELSPYRADRRILRQILINLLSNAIKFTPAGGEVAVEAHVDAADDLVITVRDNGKGITEEDLANVFEPFVQGRIQGSSPGTGLGLPLSRTFARLHGGELFVESKLEQGTTARLLLPSWRWRRSAALEAAPPPNQPGGSTSAQQQVASHSGPAQSTGSRAAQLK